MCFQFSSHRKFFSNFMWDVTWSKPSKYLPTHPNCNQRLTMASKALHDYLTPLCPFIVFLSHLSAVSRIFQSILLSQSLWTCWFFSLICLFLKSCMAPSLTSSMLYIDATFSVICPLIILSKIYPILLFHSVFMFNHTTYWNLIRRSIKIFG